MNISCTNCSQVLAVPANAAGKQVQCPGCQSRLVVPGQPAPKPQPVASQQQIVHCPTCQTPLSVRPAAQPTMVACPKCSAQIRVEATQPVQQTPQTTLTPSGATANHVSQANAPADLSSMPAASAPTIQRPTAPKGPGAGQKLLAWANANRWLTAIIVLNVIYAPLCLFVPELLVSWAVLLVFGVVFGVLLLIPRKHVVQRVSEAMGEGMANVGIGGFLLIVLAALAKGASRISRNDNVDLSGFMDPGQMGGLLAGLGITAACAVGFLLLWRWIGIARVLASVYYVAFGIVFLSSVLVVVRHDELQGHRPRHQANATTSLDARNPPTIRNQPDSFSAARARQEQMRESFEARRRAAMEGRSTTERPAATNDAAENETPAATKRPSANISSTVKRRPIDIDLPPGTKVLDASTKVSKGTRLQACYTKKWYWVTVVAANQDGTVKVNWDDWPTFTYDMIREDLVIEE